MGVSGVCLGGVSGVSGVCLGCLWVVSGKCLCAVSGRGLCAVTGKGLCPVSGLSQLICNGLLGLDNPPPAPASACAGCALVNRARHLECLQRGRGMEAEGWEGCGGELDSKLTEL